MRLGRIAIVATSLVGLAGGVLPTTGNAGGALEGQAPPGDPKGYVPRDVSRPKSPSLRELLTAGWQIVGYTGGNVSSYVLLRKNSDLTQCEVITPNADKTFCINISDFAN